MVTKTLTITEEAYGILAKKKQQDESFSEEIIRLLSKRKTKSLQDYFGILCPEEGEIMHKDLEKMRTMNLKFLRERLKDESC